MQSDMRTSHSSVAVPTTAMLVKELLGAILLQFISLFAFWFLFLPEIKWLFHSAILSKAALTGMTFISSLLLTAIVVFFPLFLLRECLRNLRIARVLDQRGVLIDAYILDKWVDHSAGRSIFCIRYKYLQHRKAVQMVNRIVFDRLT